jgi:hypothetical protein
MPGQTRSLYLQPLQRPTGPTSIPATHTPSFDVEPGARLIPVNDLVRLTGAASGYTVIGGGKTAMDACIWLLDSSAHPHVRKCRASRRKA